MFPENILNLGQINSYKDNNQRKWCRDAAYWYSNPAWSNAVLTGLQSTDVGCWSVVTKQAVWWNHTASCWQRLLCGSITLLFHCFVSVFVYQWAVSLPLLLFLKVFILVCPFLNWITVYQLMPYQLFKVSGAWSYRCEWNTCQNLAVTQWPLTCGRMDRKFIFYCLISS